MRKAISAGMVLTAAFVPGCGSRRRCPESIQYGQRSNRSGAATGLLPVENTEVSMRSLQAPEFHIDCP